MKSMATTSPRGSAERAVRPSWPVKSKSGRPCAHRHQDSIHRVSLRRRRQSDCERERVTREIGDYYAACMDEKGIDARGLNALKPELDRIRDLKDKAQLAEEAAHLQRSGTGGFFDFGSGQDFKDSTAVIAQLDQGGLGLPERDYYL